MSGINFIGSYSGIDQTSIDKLMEAEKLPLVQLANKKTNLTAKQNAWKDINTRLNSLFDKLKVLQNNETFTAKASSSSNESMVTMTPSKNSVAGSYKVKVEQLATSTSIISGDIALAKDPTTENVDINKALEISGKFTITNGDNVSREITIGENDSLKTIVENINKVTKDITVDGVTTKGTGVSATLIDGRLVLTDTKTGSRNITLSDYDSNEDGTYDSISDDGPLSKLGLASVSQNTGKNAKFNINGVDVVRSSNSVSDVIEYTTIHLHKEHTDGQYDTVNISLDTSKLTKAVQDFVDQYNSTMTFIEDKLAAGDPEVAGSKGTLAGDSSLMRLHSSLRNFVTSSISNDKTNIKDISQLGVTTIDKFGKLQFDSSKLLDALKENPENVMNFFTSKDGEDKEVGFSPRLKDYVDSYISSSDGIIKGKSESFDKTLKDLTKQIDRFNLRMEKKQAQYIKMFTALDVAMMEAESQMSWLVGQIDAMNVSRK